MSADDAGSSKSNADVALSALPRDSRLPREAASNKSVVAADALLSRRTEPGLLTSASQAQQPTREFLVFSLAGELYGIELRRIREILSLPTLTLVPRAPKDVLGICSVRGLLVTVVDLRRRMNLECRATTRHSRVLLSETSTGEIVGLLVDDVRNVVRFTPDEVELLQGVLGGELSDHVLGIGRPSGEPIVLLDQRSITG